jgi:hypothetical protein
MNPDEEWALWRKWLGREPKGHTINAEVVEMLAFRKVWRAFGLVQKWAPEQTREYSIFPWWINWNYARSMGLAVRRQLDRGPDVVSLGRLIDRVWRYPTVASRERFRLLQEEDDWPQANRWFDETFGGGPFINPEVPARDWGHLWKKTTKVRGWVNNAVAHLNERERKPPPYGEIHRCIDIVVELFEKYVRLIEGVTFIGEVVMPPWPAVFRTAWIPEERWPETMVEIQRVEREGLF